MEIEPTPLHEHSVGVYGRMPSEALEAEKIRIRALASDLVGRLMVIEQVRETSNEHSLSN